MKHLCHALLFILRDWTCIINALRKGRFDPLP